MPDPGPGEARVRVRAANPDARERVWGSALLGVPAHQQPAYGEAAQSRYARDLDGAAHTPAAWLSVLNETARPFRSDAADLALER